MPAKKPPKVARLKVFRMEAGFYDAVVAVPSRAAALRAWGTTTDLFAAGRAREVDDANLIAKAIASPGEVIKVPRGDETAMLGPEPAKPFEDKQAGRSSKPKPRTVRVVKPNAAPDRSVLDAAEHAVREAHEAAEAALQGLAIERAALERREDEVRRAGEQAVAEAMRARNKAAAAYERALAANDNRTRS